MNAITEHGVYWLCIALMMTGLYIVISRDHLVKKIMGLNIFQVSVIMLYVTMAKISGGTAPILQAQGSESAEAVYSNPLPHVLMLPAIVVGVATLGVGLALAQKIYQQHSSFDEDEILENQRK